MSDASDGDEKSSTEDHDHDHDHDRNRDPDRNREPPRSGKALLVAVFVGAVSVAGGFGFFVGTIGPRALGSVGVFGVTIFRPTPTGMALYGMTITTLVLGVLYVGARFAIRREERPSGNR